jgi:lipopolysaccharide/colanic/teichoic acid biosynthesis glycosyltransferase
MNRVFDIMASSLALLALSPLFLIAMLILRLTGEGKVWYRQERVGYGGERFWVFKFVTMRSDSESTGSKDITVRDDPRVLPVGRVLRKAKINEVPQFINIFLGDMSVVGWRPLMPKSFAMYPEHVQRQIVRVKPGLTGIGSIVFRDEEAIVERQRPKPPRSIYLEDIAPHKGELELWYQRHQSFALDMKLIAATVWAVVFPANTNMEKWFKRLPQRPDATEESCPA